MLGGKGREFASKKSGRMGARKKGFSGGRARTLERGALSVPRGGGEGGCTDEGGKKREKPNVSNTEGGFAEGKEEKNRI